MSRLSIETPGRAQTVLDGLHRDMDRRINASAHGLCPVDMSLNYLRLCHAQTCGKCVPCRIGLGQLENLIEQVLDGDATMETIDTIERTARVIADSAGCAIGYEGAHMVLKGIRGFREDYEEHVLHIQDALKDLLGDTIKEMMEAEMDDHLGYESYERSDNPNSRNGYKQKQIRSKYGETTLSAPQDRDSAFEPNHLYVRQRHDYKADL